MDDSLFHQLRTLVTFEIHSFEKRLEQLRSSHYPSKVAVEFIDCLNDERKAQRSAIDQIVADHPHDPKGAGERLRSEHRRLVDKLSHLNSLKNAQTQEVPWSVVPSIERLASRLIPSNHLLTTCTPDLNYMIRWHQSPKSSIQRFLVLELPEIHKTNVFLHILVGHELFHPLLGDFFKKTGPSVVGRLRGPCEVLLKEIAPTRQAQQDDRLDTVVETARYIWQRALEEVMCDMGCAAVFGPAALFASSVFHLTANLDEPPTHASQFYPPPRFRLRQVLRFAFQDWACRLEQRPSTVPQADSGEPLDKLWQLLGEKGLTEASNVLTEQFRIFKKEAEKQTDLEEIAKLPLVKIAYGEVAKSLDEAWEYVREKAESADLGWVATINDVPDLMKSLKLSVPPGEIREETEDKSDTDSSEKSNDDAKKPKKLRTRAPSLSAIAIATWLYQLNQENQMRSGSAEDLLVQYHRSCRLMLKAFEDVELRRAYDSYKENARNREPDELSNTDECPDK